MAHVTKYGNPKAVTRSNYYATKDQETCTNCSTCVERCQVNAIRSEDDHTVIDSERCIGCGLCVSTCPSGSITMVHKSPQEASAIFASDIEMLQAIGKEAGKVYPFE